MNQFNRETQKTQNQPEQIEEGSVRIDGFEQVLQMLRVADNEFRESLLKRLGARDPRLVAKLRSALRM